MSDEIFPIVKEDGSVIGRATRSECHGGSMLLHPVVHLHVISRDGGRIYLQQRSFNKDIQPGRWDTAVGGHVGYGETVEDALKREAREEIGIALRDARRMVTYPFTSDRERELVNVFYILVDEADFAPCLNEEEIVDGRFWSGDEIAAAIGKGILTPNFEQEYQRIIPLLGI